MQLAAAVQADPRVVDRSATAEVAEWTVDPRYLRVAAGWTWIGEAGQPGNLVVVLDSDGVTVVRESYRPTDATKEGSAL